MFNLYGFNIDEFVGNPSYFVCTRFTDELTLARNKGM